MFKKIKEKVFGLFGKKKSSELEVLHNMYKRELIEKITGFLSDGNLFESSFDIEKYNKEAFSKIKTIGDLKEGQSSFIRAGNSKAKKQKNSSFLTFGRFEEIINSTSEKREELLKELFEEVDSHERKNKQVI